MRDTSKATDKNSNPGTQYIYCADNSLSITKTLSWPPKAWASPKHRADLRNRNNTSLGSQPMEVWFQFPPSKLPKMPGTNNPNPPSSSSRPLKVRMQQTWTWGPNFQNYDLLTLLFALRLEAGIWRVTLYSVLLSSSSPIKLASRTYKLALTICSRSFLRLWVNISSLKEEDLEGDKGIIMALRYWN